MSKLYAFKCTSRRGESHLYDYGDLSWGVSNDSDRDIVQKLRIGAIHLTTEGDRWERVEVVEVVKKSRALPFLATLALGMVIGHVLGVIL